MLNLISHIIEYVAIDKLKAARRNPRTHGAKQIKLLAKLIRTYGFTAPLLIADDDTIIAGHGRLQAAISLGMTEVPCIRLPHLSPHEQQAYLIADNRVAELAGWDKAALALELKELSELDFDLSATGFELPQIDILIQDAVAASPKRSEAQDEIPDPPAAQEIVARWLAGLGRSRVSRPSYAPTDPARGNRHAAI